MYLAKDKVLNRCVAIKVLSKEIALGDENRTRLLREARAMAAVDHPRVVHVYSFGEVDGQV